MFQRFNKAAGIEAQLSILIQGNAVASQSEQGRSLLHQSVCLAHDAVHWLSGAVGEESQLPAVGTRPGKCLHCSWDCLGSLVENSGDIKQNGLDHCQIMPEP